MIIDESERLGLALSALTVVLFIIAIAIFIHYGAGAPFYVVVVMAFIVGFLNAWVISRTEVRGPEIHQPSASRIGAARRRRGAHARRRKGGR